MYVIQVAHKFMFEHLHNYLNRLDDMVVEFETHLRETTKLGLESSGNEELAKYYTEEDGSLPGGEGGPATVSPKAIDDAVEVSAPLYAESPSAEVDDEDY